MKRCIAVAIVLPALAFGQSTGEPQSDIRVVNGRKVDLLPLHQWYQNPEDADRPLKHWVRLTVLDINPVFGGSYLKCEVESDTARQQVLFKSLPETTRETVNTIQSLQTNLLALQREIEFQEPIVRRDEAQYEGSVVRSTTYELLPNLGTRRYEYERPSRRAVNARLDRIALEEKQQLASKLYEDLAALQQNTNSYTVFAMDTGRKFGGLAIWDTGLPANP